MNEKLPWNPLLPAFGLEEFGLPIPRRNADTWRHFDVPGMVTQDYSGTPEGIGTLCIVCLCVSLLVLRGVVGLFTWDGLVDYGIGYAHHRYPSFSFF